jgi:hypothetical protein
VLAVVIADGLEYTGATALLHRVTWLWPITALLFQRMDRLHVLKSG